MSMRLFNEGELIHAGFNLSRGWWEAYRVWTFRRVAQKCRSIWPTSAEAVYTFEKKKKKKVAHPLRRRDNDKLQRGAGGAVANNRPFQAQMLNNYRCNSPHGSTSCDARHFMKGVWQIYPSYNILRLLFWGQEHSKQSLHPQNSSIQKNRRKKNTAQENNQSFEDLKTTGSDI